MKITDLSIKRSVTITMMMLALTLIGAFAMVKLPIQLYPTMDLPFAYVDVSWPGSSPEEVAQQVTRPIEQALKGLSGVSEIDTQSLQGDSQVYVLFNFGVDLSQEVEQMRSIVNMVQRELPKDATAPLIQQYNPTQEPIMTVSLSGDEPLAALTDLGNNVIKPALNNLNGIGTIDSIGSMQRQINVQVDPKRLDFYHLSIEQVVQALSTGNMSIDAGEVNKGSLLIPLHIEGQFNSVSQISSIPISLGKGSITLGDVATVQDGYADNKLISTVNGKPAISFSIIQATNANTVQVSQEVHQALSDLQTQLPKDVHVTVVSDSAKTIQDTIGTVISHTLIGFILGVLLILLILRSVRTTVVIAVAIPIAVLSTFILMYVNGLTINTVTLGSLAVGLGSLVDFSIVVLESIFRARQSGLNSIEAAKKGTSEVGLAVVVAAMAQICVFAPSIFVPGIAGQFFGPIALTVSFSHIAALFVAITFTPMLAAKFLKGRRFEEEEKIPGKNAPFRIWSPFSWVGRGIYDLNALYRRVLKWGLNHRKTVIIASVMMLFASYALVPFIGFELNPNVASNQLNVGITLADGTSLAHTNSVTQTVEELARRNLPGVQSLYAQIGSTNYETMDATNSSNVLITLDQKYTPSINKIAHDFQNYVQNIPGAKILVSLQSPQNGPSSDSIGVQIQGSDPGTLTILSNEVAQIMRKTPGLEYVDNTLANGTPNYQLNVSQAALTEYGLTEQQVETALRDAFQGTAASSFFQGNQQYDIVVQFPENFTRNLSNLSQIALMNNAGNMIPLQQIATLTQSVNPPVIKGVNGVRTVAVNANVYGVSSGQIQQHLTQEFQKLRIPAGYSINFGENGKFLHDTLIDLGLAVLFSIVLLYMVMASLFESFLTPFVIMFCLPPTFVGAAIGLFVTHRSLNVDSIIGVIMVMGLIANNAIVLIDYANQLRARGRNLYEALLEAGPIRLRPILMSTLTTVLAMTPLVLGFGTGAETLASMSTVIAFGLLFSTVVTLVLVPVMYITIEKLINRIKRMFVKNARPETNSIGI